MPMSFDARQRFKFCSVTGFKNAGFTTGGFLFLRPPPIFINSANEQTQ